VIPATAVLGLNVHVPELAHCENFPHPNPLAFWVFPLFFLDGSNFRTPFRRASGIVTTIELSGGNTTRLGVMPNESNHGTRASPNFSPWEAP
jgi:hypothetical protein